MAEKKRRIPGISVYPRGKKWAYLVEGAPDLVTGDRQRMYKGGFETEDDAWEAALALKAQVDAGRVVKPSSRTLEQFLREWLPAVEPALKPSTYRNYVDNAESYVYPLIGHHPLQGGLSVPVLNAYYARLAESGRIKGDGNARMYAYWLQHKEKRDGQGPGPTELSKVCDTSYHAARKAVHRYQHGRIPVDYSAGLARKSILNVHRLLHHSLDDAVAWDYVSFNAAAHASLPRRRRGQKTTEQPWSLEELARWLQVAMRDRFAGMWVLVATTGMRRSELAGSTRTGLKLDAAVLSLLDTRVVVNGQVIDEDGKSDAGERDVSLDVFTVAALRDHVAMLDDERRAFGSGYENNDELFVWEDGSRPHPDTITRRFNQLVDAAGVRRIRLHDIRHTYATLSLDSGVNVKVLSDRIGHAQLLKDYVHQTKGADRAAADQIGKLIGEAVGHSKPSKKAS
ncbi:tyrosine-type recombinase/integrase [Sciscionella marina]|uniref:tyrosine-type recombinase/integrase n=1 Tax=Sciscionella marina TaxID=508770 RepID=UPI00037449F3|nr:tyrosine-type recombinase/integrase [Sciscionella marina]